MTPYPLQYILQYTNPEEGQLETLPALAAPNQNELYTYKNNETGKLEQIDLRTGKIYLPYIPMQAYEFSNVVADQICQGIVDGGNLKQLLQEHKISTALFYKWISLYPEFSTRYSEARKCRADYHFHKAIDLADNAIGTPKDFIPGLKLAVDTHKWAAEKSDPERFNKSKDVQAGTGNITINLNTGVLNREAPTDIVVDSYGTFQGFGVSIESDNLEESTDIILKQDRWGVYDGGEQDSTESIGENESKQEGELGHE